MKTNLILVIVLLLLCNKVTAQPNVPSGKKWKKIEALSDEFNKGFDTKKWFKPLWNYGEPVNMKAKNSDVSNGHLWIKATNDVTKGDNERWFETSRVQSRAKIKFPMYTECKMITAHISTYNTFWLNNGDINNRDEIDIVENNSRPSCNCQPDFPWQMNSQYFIAKNGKTERNKGNFDNRNLPANNSSKGVRWNEAYHTVGAWWKDKNTVQFYLDGHPAGKVVSIQDFTREQHLIWDLWTNEASWLGGLPKREQLNNNSINTMKVDWVHTYELVDDTSSLSDNVSFENTPRAIYQKNEYSFTVNYKANSDREIVVGIYKDNKWIASTLEIVSKGTGSKLIRVKPPTILEAGKGYSYKSHIRPLNTTWREAIDNDNVENVEVIKQFIVDGSYFINSIENSQRLLARNLESHSARMHNSANFDDQKWFFKHIGNNTYTIKNEGTKRYLEVSNGECVNGANVTTWTGAVDNHQKWVVVENGNGIYGLKPVHCDGLGLDRSGGSVNANVQIWNYDVNNNNQKWNIIEVVTTNKKIAIHKGFESFIENKEKMSLHPNPSREKVYISGLKNGDEIVIYNFQGQKVKALTSNRKQEEISISGLSKGVYLIKINNKSPYKLIKK